MLLWIYFILTRDSSGKSFVFLSPRQTGSENEGLWTLWWAHWGDPVSDPEELLTEPKTQYNQTQRWWAKATELSECPSWSSCWGEILLEKWLSMCSYCKVTFSDSMLSLTSQWKCHGQTLLKASVTSSHPLLTSVTGTHSPASLFTPTGPPPCLRLQPNTRPPGTVQTQSQHTFFFLNIVKSNTSPSCTNSNCQTMFGIFPLLILLVDGSKERKTKNIKGFLLKCKLRNPFYFQLFTAINLRHFCLYMSMRTFIWSSRFSKKRAHCHVITFSF